MDSQKMGLKIKWMGCACFEMDFGGFTVVNDPWITDNTATELTWKDIEQCDIITLTHSHFDHIMDIPDLLNKFSPKLLTGQLTALPMLKWTDICPMVLYPMNPGLELDFDAVKIKALFGRHTVLGADWPEIKGKLERREVVRNNPLVRELAMIGSIEYLNFLYTMPNGVKVLVWGNELTPDQCNILREVKPDIAILQMTKNTPEDTAKICIEMGSKVVIPNHIDFPEDYTHLAVGLKQELAKHAPEVNCIIPQYGEWIEL